MSLPRSSSSLPPGAGKDANQFEYYELELGEKGYLGLIGQEHGHAAAIRANRDGDKATVPLLLTHQATKLLVWR